MERLLTIDEVAQIPPLSKSTLRWLRHTQRGPTAVRLGRRLYYRESDVRAWIDAQFDRGQQDGA